MPAVGVIVVAWGGPGSGCRLLCIAAASWYDVAYMYKIKSNGVFTPGQDNDKTTTRQMLNLCIPMMHMICRNCHWCERHHRNAQVQHLSCRCLVVVLLWCENTINLNHAGRAHCIGGDPGRGGPMEYLGGGVFMFIWGLTPQQQPGSYQGGEMTMMKSVFWWRKPEYPEETTDLRQVTDFGGGGRGYIFIHFERQGLRNM